MAQSDIHLVRPANEDGNHTPKHFIIWLDKHIGKPDECILLKCSFFMAINPTSGLYERSLNPDDIDRSIRLEMSLIVRLDEVEFMFQAFEDVEKCFHTIEKNRNKCIFFISSGSKGRLIVPSLVANFPDTFVVEHWMYIFCANMNMTQVKDADPPTNTWALQYIDHVLMFDHQDDLLARLLLDIGRYFFSEAKRLDNKEQLHSAYQHCKWSKIMYERYEKTEKRTKGAEIAAINQYMTNIEEHLNSRNDDDDAVGQSPD
ncbi:unnamed protein product [Rotaria sp. Silwood1]|nr:unnamed protein product [Rotaria sp. Silwood1]CAF1630551.1 unnamed protein product [Rotaria sp. Silwood1]